MLPDSLAPALLEQLQRARDIHVRDLAAGFGEVYLPLEGLIDVEAERTRLTKEVEKIRIEVKKCEGKLGNASFVDRAPAEVVAQEKARLAEWNERLEQLSAMIAALG